MHLHYILFFWILDAKVALPPHATWHVRRVGLPPALKALTCRLGAPAHTWKERAFSFLSRTLPLGQCTYRAGSRLACPTVEVAREVGAGAHSRTARALREEGLVDSVRDVRRRDQLGKEVRHILALAVYNITYNINLKYD